MLPVRGRLMRSNKPTLPRAPMPKAPVPEHAEQNATWPWHSLRAACATELGLAPAVAWYLGAEALGASGWAVDAYTPQWLAAPICLNDVQLHDREHAELSSGETIRWRLAPKIDSNRSWFTEASQQFWQAQRLRLRGDWRPDVDGQQVFEVRTLWPEAWHWHDATMVAAPEPDERRLRRERGGAQQPFAAECWWQAKTEPAHSANCQHALGFILDGGQGDDDEAHGGHFALMLGSSPEPGRAVTSTDMLVANFYNPDVVSEKGILPAFTPLDVYLSEVNAGQQNYRPTCALVLTLNSADCLWPLYQQLALQMHRLYNHHLHYDHAAMNCTGISMDALAAIGYRPALRGPSSRIMAVLAGLVTWYRERDKARARRVFRYFLTEQTRLLPAQAYFACQQQLTALLNGARQPDSPWSQTLMRDASKLYRLHFPQVPSSRAFGREALLTLADFAARVPKRRADWQTIPSRTRAFPEHLRRAIGESEQLPAALTGLTVPPAKGRSER